jgi:hypothetical protein
MPALLLVAGTHGRRPCAQPLGVGRSELRHGTRDASKLPLNRCQTTRGRRASGPCRTASCPPARLVSPGCKSPSNRLETCCPCHAQQGLQRFARRDREGVRQPMPWASSSATSRAFSARSARSSSDSVTTTQRNDHATPRQMLASEPRRATRPSGWRQEPHAQGGTSPPCSMSETVVHF